MFTFGVVMLSCTVGWRAITELGGRNMGTEVVAQERLWGVHCCMAESMIMSIEE